MGVEDKAEAELQARRYKPWRPSAWITSLGAEYLGAMEAEIRQVLDAGFSADDEASGFADYMRARQIFGRMEIAEQRLMPWMSPYIDLTGRTVLEIGCGTGSATAPLAMRAAFVHAFDLSAADAKIAARRCALLNLENVNIFARAAGWTEGYARDPASIAPPVDVIVCYALMEHLLPVERLDLLQGAWRHLPVGGHLIIIETPNRLYPFDWHSMQMPFIDQLPDELAFLWANYSPRADVPGDIKASGAGALARCSRERLYRFGRGASFHEFHLALGPQSYRVLNNTYPADRPSFKGYNAAHIAALELQLADVTPAVHPAFAQACLDLIIEKVSD